MADLVFDKHNLIYLPWNDTHLRREAYAIIRNVGDVSQENILQSEAEFTTAFKGTGVGWFTRLWVFSHGGDASRRIYNSNGSINLYPQKSSGSSYLKKVLITR